MMPQYLFNNKNGGCDKILNKIISCERIILFLDYDGTLVPIKKHPALAIISIKQIKILKNLIKSKNVFPILVSGREYSDIKRLVPIKNLIIASNHGFRITNGRENWIHPKVKALLPEIKKILRTLKSKLKSFPGAMVEDKKITITVHYRNAKISSVPAIKEIVEEIIKPASSKLKLTEGKKVFEIKPNIRWNKGEAVTRILKIERLRKKEAIIVFIGDDKTDEDAFERLDGRGITIRVGYSGDSSAKYFLKNTNEVRKFLETIESVNNIKDKQ